MAVLMVRNLALLNVPDEIPRNIHFGEKMFDKPNEAALFHVLYLLFRRFLPRYRDAFTVCWPVTVHLKSTFKQTLHVCE